MSSETAIELHNVTKHYFIFARPEDRLKQMIVPRLMRLAGRQPRRYFTDFVAVRDLSFKVGKGETVGIAILSHPSSFVPLPRWHTRPYGLHAANPFGVAPFLEGNPALAAEADKKTGGLAAAQGEPISLRYRIFIHRGDEKAGNVAGAYAKFAKSK